MKPSFRRLQEKYGQRHMDPTMSVYASALQRFVDAKGNGKSYRDDRRPLNIKMKPNEVYAVIAQDDDRYFRTITMKPNQLTNGFSLMVSNPVYGDPPPQMPEVSQEQVFKQMRDMNAGMVVGSDMDAFPHRGVIGNAQAAPGNGLVSQLHKDLLRGDRS